jgi:hypothetical protein
MRILFFPSLAYNEFMTLLGNCVWTRKEEEGRVGKKDMRKFP